jgi:hypothetical protein
MEQSPSWEASSDSASQEIPCLQRNPNVLPHRLSYDLIKPLQQSEEDKIRIRL